MHIAVCSYLLLSEKQSSHYFIYSTLNCILVTVQTLKWYTINSFVVSGLLTLNYREF